MAKKKEPPDRMDVRVPEDMKQRLEAVALKERRSRNLQAAYYIEMGLDGLDARQTAQQIAEIHAKMDMILEMLQKK